MTNLANGDYLEVEEKVIETLLADSGEGGLNRAAGPAVRTFGRGGSPPDSLAASQFPAVLVRASGKTETPACPAARMNKIFALEVRAAHRGRDREKIEDEIKRIAARIERVLRSQNRADAPMQALAESIEGGEGTLTCSIIQTRINETETGTDGAMASSLTGIEVAVPFCPGLAL